MSLNIYIVSNHQVVPILHSIVRILQLNNEFIVVSSNHYQILIVADYSKEIIYRSAVLFFSDLNLKSRGNMWCKIEKGG